MRPDFGLMRSSEGGSIVGLGVGGGLRTVWELDYVELTTILEGWFDVDIVGDLYGIVFVVHDCA